MITIVKTNDISFAAVHRPQGTIVVFHVAENPPDSSMVFADKSWADEHREALRQLKGYCDFSLRKPVSPLRGKQPPAEIQVFLPPDVVMKKLQQIAGK